ncbi:MAG: hypothetical protein A3J51_00730 [Omnitrophica WOR_2 bacterium RIFCSPHIGHO2_02_FULL_45_21]|nr:MAG: hypothetical protein A3J51_00730 [Omnitrophica WOR_2 bacterium RIFCSPHIGHO2_02_FULL_45_21]
MPDNPLTHFANEVSKLMPDILREFLRRQTREISQGNISLPQILILDALKERASMRMGELAEYLSVSMAATTGIANKLVKNGFVLRTGTPHDRRIVNISITPKGRKTVNEYNRARQKTIIEIFGSLSSSDRSKYLEILNKIHYRLR